MRTHVRFDDDERYQLTEQAVTAFASYARGPWTYRVALGALLGGTLDGERTPGAYDLGPGVVTALAAARRWTFGDDRWFATGSASLSLAATTTNPGDARFVAGDARVGAMVGRTFAGRVSPYLVTRVFGGPVFWTLAGDDVVGSDTTHVQLGAGVSVSLPYGLSATVDLSAVGEQSLSVAIGWQL